MCAALLGSEYDVTDTVISCRRTESCDAPHISRLASSYSHQQFGRVNVQDLIERSTLAITLCSDDKEIVGHAAFFDYPNLSTDGSDWVEWFVKIRLMTDFKCSAMNTLFLHYFVSQADYADGSARQLIKAAFNALPFVHVCMITLPAHAQLEQSLKELFQPVSRLDSSPEDTQVFACYRVNVSGTLLIRDARVEDNDDLAPLLQRYSSSLSDRYGDYFLAELIEAQDDHMKCLVAEVDGVAIGFMSISLEVNTKLINDCFELYRFNYLLPKTALESGGRRGSSRASPATSLNHLEGKEVTIGPNEAFCIQLFCIDEKYEMRSCDFLPFAFMKFKGRKYCTISVPHLVPQFPLLQDFIRITPCISSTFPQELYLYSASGLMPGFTVRHLTESDVSAINRLLHTLDVQKYMDDLTKYINRHRDDDGREQEMFVAVIGQQIVGFAKISQEEDIEYIRSHYDIEEFIYFSQHRRCEHANLQYFLLLPIFKHFSRQFLKEILRIGRKTCLYQRTYPPYSDIRTDTQVTCLEYLLPVRARRQIVYPEEILAHNVVSDRITATQQPFALNHINRKLVLESKAVINARIVVVGASDVGVSFLDTFSFCPHMRFNNITLISPHGLPGDYKSDDISNRMIAQSLCYSSDDHARMSLRTWVNVVKNKMTGLDRHKKLVKLSDGSVVPYDYLVLCSGTQYQKPVASTVGTCSASDCPRNLFTLNDEYDVEQLMHWLTRNPPSEHYKVIVYGNDLGAHCCIQCLLCHGLDSDQVVLVTPIRESKVPVFTDPNIEHMYATALAKTGVQVHSGCELIDWTESSDDCSLIQQATFKSADDEFTMDCAAIVCFVNKDVDRELFEAVNCASLVYDGRLVIDGEFMTNDPVIRAAGPMTKYKRSYYASDITHAIYNSKEIGAKLAVSMMSIFDETLQQTSTTGSKGDTRILPSYSGPKVSAGFIADCYYMHVEKPKGLERLYTTDHDTRPMGQDLVTGYPKASCEYFRIHVDNYGIIDSFTCFSSKEFSASNLLCLYGMHEKYLNNLLSRYDEGLITDFYRYFEEPWAMAIFHDRFHSFCEEMRDTLASCSVDGGTSMAESVHKMMIEERSITNAGRKMIADGYSSRGYKQSIEKKLFGFLTYNSYHLPMYSRPAMI